MALSWLNTLPDGELQGLALNNVLDVWCVKNAQDAGRYVAQMSEGAGQDAAAGHLAQDIATTDPLVAIHWAESLESDSARTVALVGISSA